MVHSIKLLLLAPTNNFENPPWTLVTCRNQFQTKCGGGFKGLSGPPLTHPRNSNPYFPLLHPFQFEISTRFWPKSSWKEKPKTSQKLESAEMKKSLKFKEWPRLIFVFSLDDVSCFPPTLLHLPKSAWNFKTTSKPVFWRNPTKDNLGPIIFLLFKFDLCWSGLIKNMLKFL